MMSRDGLERFRSCLNLKDQQKRRWIFFYHRGQFNRSK